MILSLLRRDYALRFLGRWAIIGPVTGLTFLSLLVSARAASGVGTELTALEIFLVVVALWAPISIDLGMTAVAPRAGRFDLTIPVAGRDLWVAHTVAACISSVSVAAITATVAGGLAWIIVTKLGAGHFAYALEIPVIAVRSVAAASLVAVLFQSRLPSLSRLPRGRRTSALIVFVLFVFLGVTYAFSLIPAWWSIALPIAALVVARRTYGLIPPALALLPRKASEEPGGGEAQDVGLASVPRRGFGFSWFLLWVFYRSTTKVPLGPAIVFPILFGFGMVLAGFKRAVFGGDIIRFAFVILTAYILLAGSGLPPRKLFTFDPLPISRRRIFAAVTLPLVIVLSLGYAGGRIWAETRGGQRELIRLAEYDCCHYVQVPYEICEVSWDGRPVTITSPWGESVTPRADHLREGGQVYIYSPFATNDDSSLEFVALQISRAVEALYGRQIHPDEIADRYLTVGPDGFVVPKGDGLTLARDYPELTPLSGGPIFPVVMMVILGLWYASFALYLRTLRAAVSERIRKGAFWGSMIGLLVLHMWQFFAPVVNEVSLTEFGAFWGIAIRHLGLAVPGGSVTVWVLCSLIVFGVYRVAERQFVRAESLPGDESHMDMMPLINWAARPDGVRQ
jgi:hypothetical protein